MKRLSIWLVVFFLSFNSVYAEVTKFVFVTEERTVQPGTISETLTIQSQNESDTAEDVTETMDFVFTSTSGTGEFLSTSGNPVSGTMSRGTSNKNFVYRDSALGGHTINVSITGRTSGRTFSASQNITVRDSSSQSTTTQNTSTTTQSTSSNNSTSQNTETKIVYIYSAHSSSNDLSNDEPKMEFEISAGRNRLTSAGSSVEFKAQPTKLQNISERLISYEWSFGDGTTEKGQMVKHAYTFPGEYEVVLNAYASDKQATSRTKVNVINPELSVKKVSGGVSVLNKSLQEINLEGWKIISQNKEFVFPKDTIIAKGKEILIDDAVTGIVSGDLEILNPKNKIYAKSDTLVLESKKIEEDIQTQITKAKEEVQKLVLAYEKIPKEELMPPKKVVITEDKVTPKENEIQNTANVISVFEAKPKKGIVGTLFSWPLSGVDYLLSIFSRD